MPSHTHTHAHGLRPVLHGHTHTCVLHKQGARGHASRRLIAYDASVLMFECVTSHRCVLQTSADICLLRQGCCCDLGCVSFTHTGTRVHWRRIGNPGRGQ